MKKKIFSVIAAAVAFIVVFTTCRKEYVDVVVTGITRNNPATAVLEVNGTMTLSVTVLPADAYYKYVRWTSSNEAIAEVSTVISGDTLCTVTAKAPGEVTIIATTEEGGFTATFNITVTRSVSGLSISPSILSLVEGETGHLTVSIVPPNASDQAIKWSSSDVTVASVDNDGNVTAHKASTTEVIITATTQDESKSATCRVTVTEAAVPVASVAVFPSNLNLVVGDTITLLPVISPANATNKSVSWLSSNALIAEVNTTTGKVEAKAAGTATITVTAFGGETGTCAVTVSAAEVPATGITLDNDTLTFVSTGRYSLAWDEKDTITLQATVIPAEATNKTVTWESSNPLIATVDVNTGKVTTVAPGEVSIIAKTPNGITAICNITVIPEFVDVIVTLINPINPPATDHIMTLAGSTESNLTVSVLPPKVAQGVIWSSSDSTVAIATGVNTTTGRVVSEPPAIGNINPRTAIIYATSIADPTKRDSCIVTVTYVAIDANGLSLSKTATSLAPGASETLTVDFTPTHASIKDVTWSTDNPSVAVVSNGTIFGVGSGSANITVTADDGGETDICVVTVP